MGHFLLPALFFRSVEEVDDPAMSILAHSNMLYRTDGHDYYS